MYRLRKKNANSFSTRAVSGIRRPFSSFMPFVRRRNRTHQNYDKKNRHSTTQRSRRTEETRRNHDPLQKRGLLLPFSPSIRNHYHRTLRLVFRLPPKQNYPIPRKHHQNQLRHRKLCQSSCAIPKPQNDRP